MSSQVLQIKFLSQKAKDVYKHGDLLNYQTVGSSGFDLRALSITDSQNNKYDLEKEDFILKPNERIQVPTGLSFAIKQNYEIQVRSRSGLAWKSGIFVLNSPGTVDSDYRGEICSILLNTSSDNFVIKLGDRIAQAVLCPVIFANFEFVEELDDTSRGAGGFGSTGV